VKYPSLKNVSLVVIDARKWSQLADVVTRGALMALSGRLDCHILVVVSTERVAARLEQLGEDTGLDMVFHAESLVDSAEFLERCSSAKCVVLVGSDAGSALERHNLVEHRIPVVVCGRTKNIAEGLPDATVLQLSNALEFKAVLEQKVSQALQGRTYPRSQRH
jgi:hypothetical protein